MFQGSNEVYKPLLYDSGRAICFALTCLYSTVFYLEKVSSTTMESLDEEPQEFLVFGGLRKGTSSA